jgi:hypothetical protein
MTTSPACSALSRCSPPLSGGLWRRRALTARSPRGQHRERDPLLAQHDHLGPSDKNAQCAEARPPSQMPIDKRTLGSRTQRLTREPPPMRCPPPKRSSMKRRIDVVSTSVWSTALTLAHGLITSSRSRGPRPQRPVCGSSVWPVAGTGGPHWYPATVARRPRARRRSRCRS